MHLRNRIFPSISQRTLENILLFVLAVILYSYGMGSTPAKLHPFEGWIDEQLAVFGKGWSAVWHEWSQLGQNDTIASVRSPVWMVLLYLSKLVFTDELLAHRVPSVLLTAFTPVLMAEIVRQFFRRDLALIAGLLVVGSQQFMLLGRIGGYVGPTTSLLMLIFLAGMRIAWGNERKAWIPFTIGMLLMPMFYSTIRYMCFMSVAIIALAFIRSSSFRKRHWLPCLISVCAFGALMSVYVSTHYTRSITATLIDFIGARGEQMLITAATVQGDASQESSIITRVYTAAKTKIDENLPKVLPVYLNGQRFFFWHYQAYEHTFHFWLAQFFFVGFALATIQAWSNPRYLFLLAWSVLGWFPLLFTTGLTNNRMLSSLPADMLIAALGPVVLGDWIISRLGNKSRSGVYAALLGLALYFVCFSFYYFVRDCERFCNS